MRVSVHVLCVLLLVPGLLVSPALSTMGHAQEATNDNNLAIARGHDGKEAFERGDYAAAEEAFREADGLVHSPVFVLFLARSQRAQGKLLEARATYEHVVSEPLDDTSPPRWRTAVSEAREERAKLVATIPTVTVTRGATVDGVVSNGEPVAVNPGTHEVRGMAGGRMIAKSIVVAAGEHRTVTLETLTVPPPLPRRPAPSPRPNPVRERGMSPLVITGAVALAVGGASHAASIITGVLAMDRAASAREVCGPTGRCAADTDGLYDASLTTSYVSTAFMVIGSVAAVAGTVLVLVPNEEASVAIGPGGVRLTVAF